MFEDLESSDITKSNLGIVKADNVVSGSGGEELIAKSSVLVAGCAIDGFVVGVDGDGDVVFDKGGKGTNFMDRMSGKVDRGGVFNGGNDSLVIVVFEKE